MAPQPISTPSEASSSFSSGVATPPPSASSARSLPAHQAAGAGAASYKLFIGGLSSQTTHEVLRAHFSQYGRLVDAVVMTKNGRPRGFGFVAFDSPDGATAVLAEPQWLDGRFVDVKRAVPGEHAQERPSNKIFVGGLPQDATTEDLRACFASYGPVSDAVVMVDRRTKRSRGFGFVRFAGGAQGSAAAEAVLMDAASHRLGGKWIEVKKATPAALLRELSPSSAGEASSPNSAASTAASSASSTPTEAWAAAMRGGAAARGRGGAEQRHLRQLQEQQQQQQQRQQRQQQQQQQQQQEQEQEQQEQLLQACLYYECLAAAAAATSGSRAGADAAAWNEPSAAAAALAALSAMGGVGDDASAMAMASDLAAGCKSHARGRRGRRSRRGATCADDEQVFARWAGFDMTSLGQFETCAKDMNEPSTPKASNENKPVLANGASSLVQCPPGLGINASPMKVPCRNKSLEEGALAFTREDFLSLQVRPWLSVS